MPADGKEIRLREILREMGDCIVAFSGGVDSALLLHVATEELGDRALAITARSESLAAREYDGALSFAQRSGIRHEIVQTFELDNPEYARNPVNRCYHCKTELYGSLTKIARERGFRWVADGFNKDDEGDWRPGRKAAKEHGVRSPLNEAELTKNDVRLLARKLGLEVWDKPALACLSSRFPYGTEITLDLLRRVDRAERAVLDAGIRSCRVRHHGDIARIEVDTAEMDAALERRETIVEGVRAAGYRYATLDLGGYVRGGFNAT